jgi:hypothetical protein
MKRREFIALRGSAAPGDGFDLADDIGDCTLASPAAKS